MKKLFITTVLLLLFLLSDCIMPTSDVVVSPTANMSEIKKIVVWRFRDGGKISNSGDIATTAVENALLERGYSIISFSMIREVLSSEIGYGEGMSLEAGMLTPKVLSRIHKETGADAIVIGAVSDAWQSVAWMPPCYIAASFKMISTASGELICSVSASDDGYSMERAALQMARKALAKIR